MDSKTLRKAVADGGRLDVTNKLTEAKRAAKTEQHNSECNNCVVLGTVVHLSVHTSRPDLVQFLNAGLL